MPKTINQLTTLVGAVATDDFLPLWDTSGAVTRKATIANVLSGGGAAILSTAQTFTGLKTFSAGINLGDNNLTTYKLDSWTPTLIGSTTAGASTYTNQSGRYAKIGTFVMCWFDVQLNVKGGTMAGNVDIGGLPFATRNTSGSMFYIGAIPWWQNLATNIMYAAIYVAGAGDVARIARTTAAAASMSNMPTSDLQNGSRFMGMFTYEASS